MDSKDLETNLQQYVQLRTMLDSVVVGALRYYLNAANEAEQQSHYAYLDKHLNEMINKVWEKQKDIDCPDGYVSCNGCCVPYNCVFGGDSVAPR